MEFLLSEKCSTLYIVNNHNAIANGETVHALYVKIYEEEDVKTLKSAENTEYDTLINSEANGTQEHKTSITNSSQM